MSQYYFLQLGKRTDSVKKNFSIKTLDNVLNISELNITYFSKVQFFIKHFHTRQFLTCVVI